MKANVSRVVERGDRLEDLQDKSGTKVKLSKVFGCKIMFFFPYQFKHICFGCF